MGNDLFPACRSCWACGFVFKAAHGRYKSAPVLAHFSFPGWDAGFPFGGIPNSEPAQNLRAAGLLFVKWDVDVPFGGIPNPNPKRAQAPYWPHGRLFCPQVPCSSQNHHFGEDCERPTSRRTGDQTRYVEHLVPWDQAGPSPGPTPGPSPGPEITKFRRKLCPRPQKRAHQNLEKPNSALARNLVEQV